MDAKNVTTGKPTGGAISVAPVGTPLPETVSEALDSAFKSLGYISDAGLVNSNSPSNTDIKAWGGQTVISIQSDKPDTFKFTPIEYLKKEVQELIFGADNVTETEDGGMKSEANAKELPYMSYVCDMVMKDGKLLRMVIPSAKVTNIGDLSFTDSNAVGSEITLTAVPDENGNTHINLIK